MLSDTSKSMFLILLVAFISLATASYVLLQSDVPIALQIDYIYSPENNIGILNELGQIGVEVINHNNESFSGPLLHRCLFITVGRMDGADS
jgi:hypothetical protein